MATSGDVLVHHFKRLYEAIGLPWSQECATEIRAVCEAQVTAHAVGGILPVGTCGLCGGRLQGAVATDGYAYLCTGCGRRFLCKTGD